MELPPTERRITIQVEAQMFTTPIRVGHAVAVVLALPFVLFGLRIAALIVPIVIRAVVPVVVHVVASVAK